MPWIQAHLIVKREQADLAELVFEQIGAVSITLGDAQDEPVLETLPDEIRLWSLVKITALFEFDAAISDHIRHSINQAFSSDISQQLQIEKLEDQEWERVWLEYFKPMKFGDHLWICPTGQQVNEDDALVIDLDPGLAFGTGTHPTTALCLQWIDQHDLSNKQVTDYGCGSGILAIAALKKGAQHVLAVDYDPQALLATEDNARNNHVIDNITVAKNTPADFPANDVLLANILAGVLIDFAGDFAKQVKAHGQIVLSGILSEQIYDVLTAYKPYFNMQAAVEHEGWARLEGTRLSD